MNKKVMYALLAILLTILVIAALVVIGGIGTKNILDKDSGSSTEGVITDSVNGKVDDLEEEPILGDEDNALQNRPESIISSAESTTPNQNVNSEKPQENSKPSESKPTESKPTNATVSDKDPSNIDLDEYEKFLKMTSADQQQYIDSFSSIDAFFDWYNAAKKAYEKANPTIDVGDGEINMGDIIEGKE